MTTVTIETEYITQLRDEAIRRGRPADRVTAYTEADPRMGSLEWDTDLTAAELNTVNEFRQWLRSGLAVTFAEFQALLPALGTLRAFRTRSGSPTNAQVVAAVDAIIDVLRATLRD